MLQTGIVVDLLWGVGLYFFGCLLTAPATATCVVAAATQPTVPAATRSYFQRNVGLGLGFDQRRRRVSRRRGGGGKRC